MLGRSLPLLWECTLGIGLRHEFDINFDTKAQLSVIVEKKAYMESNFLINLILPLTSDPGDYVRIP